MSEEPIARRVRRYKLEEYFRSLHCVRWPGSLYDLTDDRELVEAVAFLERILDALGL